MFDEVYEYWDTFDARVADEAESGDYSKLDQTIRTIVSCQQWRPLESEEPGIHRQNRMLSSLWSVFSQAAMYYSADSDKHDKLLTLLRTIDECGSIALQEASSCPRIRSRPASMFGHGIFAGLPGFAENFYSDWSDYQGFITQGQRRNLSSFIARLVCTGVCGNEFSAFALMDFRDALEREETVPELRELVFIWLKYAPEKLRFLSVVSFDTFECIPRSRRIEALAPGDLGREFGVQAIGFSPARWWMWKSRLTQLARGFHQIGLETEASLNFIRESLRLMEECDGILGRPVDEKTGEVCMDDYVLERHSSEEESKKNDPMVES